MIDNALIFNVCHCWVTSSCANFSANRRANKHTCSLLSRDYFGVTGSRTNFVFDWSRNGNTDLKDVTESNLKKFISRVETSFSFHRELILFSSAGTKRSICYNKVIIVTLPSKHVIQLWHLVHCIFKFLFN